MALKCLFVHIYCHYDFATALNVGLMTDDGVLQSTINWLCQSHRKVNSGLCLLFYLVEATTVEQLGLYLAVKRAKTQTESSFIFGTGN